MIITTCSICKKYAEDGGLKNGQFVCHECLSWIDALETKITEQFKHRELS